MSQSEFENLLKECLELHNKKAHDYSSDSDKYSNFKRAAEILSWFKNPIDQVFACMIGIKLARLAELRNGKEAKNESTRDSGIDLVNYAALWQSFYDSTNSFVCHICKISYWKFDFLKEHLKVAHGIYNMPDTTIQIPVPCPECKSDIINYHYLDCSKVRINKNDKI